MLSRLARSALDLVFPMHCCGCGREGIILCSQCVDGLERLASPYCRICAAPGVDGVCRWCLQYPRGFESLRSAFKFEGPLREAIHALKYRGVRASAEALSGLMGEYLDRNPVSVDAIVPVPLHSRRLRSRGYNQSSLLARGVGNHLDLPVSETLLLRTKDARPQIEAQTRVERRNNVSGGFRCREDASGLTILLIDDVATTGSTLSECAFALKAAGASRVYALTLARDA